MKEISPSSSPNQSSKDQKPVLIVLAVVAVLVITGLVGILAFRSGQLRQLSTIPTPTPIITISPTPETSAPTITPALDSDLTPKPTFSPTLTSTPTIPRQADLYISEYSFDHPPTKGEEFTVKIGVYNQGNAAAGAFWWEWWSSSAKRICRERIDGLAAHGGRIVYCPHTYAGWSNYATKAVADADDEVAESDEENNAHTENIIPIH